MVLLVLQTILKLKLEFDVKLKNQETKQEPTIFEMPLYE